MRVIEKLTSPSLLFRAQAQTGEGPVWSDGDLVWVDIPSGDIHRTNVSTGLTHTINVDALVGAVSEIEGSTDLLVAMEKGFARLQGTSLTVIDQVLDSLTHRMNDAKCDSLGRFWSGSCAKDFSKGMGALHVFTEDESSQIVVDGFTLPNGLGWTVDNKIMYFVDSVAHQIYRGDFDLATGHLGPLGLLADVNFGFPDGLAVDVDGCIWLAVWGGSKVIRLSPQGEIIAEIQMPVTQPSSCAFGPDGTLYITSATGGLSEGQLAAQPLAGSLFAIQTNTHGVPISKFNPRSNLKGNQ
jgi:sugar lactone lactonase YvrE